MSALKLPPPVVVANVARKQSADAWRGTTLLEAAPPPVCEARTSAPEPPPRVEAVRAPAHAPTSRLFREEALRAYQLGFRVSTPLRVVPLSTQVLLATLALALLTALGIACFGRIDLTARGRGTMRATTGLAPLRFEIAGVVRQVAVHEGQLVEPGQVLVRLDSTQLRAALIEAEEQLQATEQRVQHDDFQARATHARDEGLLRRRRELTRARISSQNTSIRALHGDHARYAELSQTGVVAAQTARDTEAVLHREQRDFLALEDELARIEQQAATLEQTFRAGVTQREHELRDAHSRRDAARRLLAQTELRAVRRGRVEAIAVGEGDMVEVGHTVARLVSLDTLRDVQAFVPERDRAFVREGLPVRVEFDQLPVGEFGSAAAHIVRVSSEVVTQPELERVLGAAAPAGVQFSIAVRLDDDARTRALAARVGSGTLLGVRMPVRQRRLISLLFDPVRRWLD